MSISPEKYVVMDVETNGKSPRNCDLLSISIYQPDTGKIYNRFLPLELDQEVWTTHINGITKETLKNTVPLSQRDVDDMIADFDLKNRVILIYTDFDNKFIKNYFKRKRLSGYDLLHFFNFKRNIVSSKYTGGNITKDNLCRLYGIENVQEIHTGVNDCILEWKLFEKMNGNMLLVTDDKVFELNDDYIVPASFLCNFPNFKYHRGGRPEIKCFETIIKRFDIYNSNIKKFPTNFNGITIENLINSMLGIEILDPYPFLLENKKKLKYIGRLPSAYEYVPLYLNLDGTVKSVRKEDAQLEEEMNKSLLAIKDEIPQLIEFIATEIFKNQKIFSQELVVHEKENVLAVCDLSSSNAVLEIKTDANTDIKKYSEQLYYESKGRDCYILQIDWFSLNEGRLSFIIKKVNFEVNEYESDR